MASPTQFKPQNLRNPITWLPSVCLLSNPKLSSQTYGFWGIGFLYLRLQNANWEDLSVRRDLRIVYLTSFCCCVSGSRSGSCYWSLGDDNWRRSIPLVKQLFGEIIDLCGKVVEFVVLLRSAGHFLELPLESFLAYFYLMSLYTPISSTRACVR